ncbi:MAG: MBL fold metallo-hydrolase [Deltaproteobacteria bacterium]|nr:MBL fold metallo-hydrolase [Deltaproteobacteria bacterium]
MRVCLLASGSKGNSLFIEAGDSRILVDAGLSARELTRRLAMLSVRPEEIDGLFVTHEHVDHIRGLFPFANRYGTPVYTHPLTKQSILDQEKLKTWRDFDPDRGVEIGALRVGACPITHDAAAPLGFIFDTPEGRVGVATDLGMVTRLVAERLKGCRVLVLESNHDEEMLRDGPYPWFLKQRIRSRHGHLSNETSSRLLEFLLWERLEAVFLAHLSQENNTPDLAGDAALRVLARTDRCRPALLIGSQQEARLWSDGCR